MSQTARYQLLVAATAGVIFFTNLGGAGLWDMDEALYSSCAREMLHRHNLILPWFNGEMFPEKPPLMFWGMIGGFELFGVNEWGARFFSAVLGVGTALVAFHLGRILFNARVGLWTGLITASTIIFTISARAATVDSALTYFTALAFLMFVMGWKKGVVGSDPPAALCLAPLSNPQSLTSNPFPLPYAIAAYACIGVAVLGKGPVMLLPLAAMGLFLLAIGGWGEKKGDRHNLCAAPSGPFRQIVPVPFSRDAWRRLFWSAWWMRPFTAIVVIAAVAAPWYVAVGYETDPHWEWPRRFFMEFNLRPFQEPILGHGDASSLDRALAVLVSVLYYFYYIPAILIGFFPWSVFLGPTLVDTLRRLKEGRRSRGAGTRVQGSGFRVQDADSNSQSPISNASNSGPHPNPLPTNLRSVPREGTDFEMRSSDEGAAEAARWRAGVVLALCWFGTWFVLWSLVKTKLPHYLLPAYPALALLTARFIDRWLAEKKGTGTICRNGPEGAAHKLYLSSSSPFPPPWALRNAWISLILVGLGIVIAMPILAAKYFPGDGSLWRLGLLGLLLVFGGAWCWWKASRGQQEEAAITFVITAVAFLTATLGFAPSRVDRFQNAKPMIAAIVADENKEASEPISSHPVSPIATYRFFRWSTVFYGGKPVTKCDEIQGPLGPAGIGPVPRPARAVVRHHDRRVRAGDPEGISRPADGHPPRAALPGGRRDGDSPSRGVKTFADTPTLADVLSAAIDPQKSNATSV